MRLLAGLLVMILLGSQAHAACEVRQRARVPLRVINGAVLVEVMVNDRPARMILDTGAQRSVVSKDSVRALDLALDEWVATTLRGVGGLERHRNALPRSLSLGGVALERRTTTRDTSLTVGTLAPGLDGLLGRDFLSLFDLDLDLPGSAVTLYAVTGCTTGFLPWSRPYVALPVTNPAETALVVGVSLDGVKLRALLDTGAGTTVLAAPGMARMGLEPEHLAASPSATAGGLGPRRVTGWHHQFRVLAIGDDVTAAPRLWVAPIRLAPITDMLLGADWLATRRMWISYATRQVFVEHRGDVGRPASTDPRRTP